MSVVILEEWEVVIVYRLWYSSRSGGRKAIALLLILVMAVGMVPVGMASADASTPAAPTIDPPGGNFSSLIMKDLPVTISGAISVSQDVYYTIDYAMNGITPDFFSNSSHDQVSLILDCPTVVEAAVYDSSTGQWSDVTSAPFTMNAPPSIIPGGGTFTGSQTVTIENIPADDFAYYTTDGRDPQDSGASKYTGPFTLTGSATVQARVYDPVISDWSDIASADFTINAPNAPTAPAISPNSGTYDSPQTVTVSVGAALSEGQAVYYTTDGTNPTLVSFLYSEPFPLTLTAGTITTVKAAVYDTGTGLWSSTASAAFTVASAHHSNNSNNSGSITTPVIPVISEPVVATEPASDISLTQATLNGQISSTGGASCTKVNFRYRLIGATSWQDTSIKSVSLGKGAQFCALVTGLKPNAQYEFEARVYNSAGWGEGEIYSFTTTPAVLPKVVSQAASDVNIDRATLNGSITDNGGADIADGGFLWGTFDQLGSGMNQVHAAPGPGGSMTLDLTGLTKNTKYYFQTYATNMAGTGYGDVLSFETPLVPPVSATTLEATDVGYVSATLHGRITGGDENTAVGFSVSPGFNVDLYTYTQPEEDGSFSLTVNNLTPGTKYNFTAFAVNQLGEKFLAPSGKDFTTLTNAPEVDTLSPTGVTSTAASISGYIKKNHGFEITDSGFLWGTEPQPGNRVVVTPGDDKRTLSYSLTGLQGGATYYVQAYAVNSEGTGYGDTISFTTQPATIPVVTTNPSALDSAGGGAVLKGRISSNGGSPLTEYGFRYGTDQKNWANLVMGQEHTGDFTSEGVYSLTNLSPETTYYVQAYAANQVGTGYGEAVSLAIPKLPTVTGSIDQSLIKATVVTLAGIITDTGGTGVTCTVRRFQYRLAGSSDWVDAGSELGSFGTGTYSFNLTGLKPGAKYEFRAQAKNPAGWGESQVVSFTTGWGESDKETALNMKAAGFSAVEIANVLKSNFGDTEAAAFEALRYAGFGTDDISAALKNSTYRASLKTVVDLLKSAGFDVVTVAGALQQVFPQEVRIFGYGHLEEGLALCLKNYGYNIDEVVKSMRALFNFQPADCISKLAGGGPPWFSYDTVYGAIARSYGAGELANYLWNNRDKWARIDSTLGNIARILKEDAGLDPLQVANILKSLYPSLDIKLMAQVFRNRGYSPGDTGSVLMKLFAADLPVVFQNLISAGYDYSDLAGLMDWLVNSMHCSALQMAVMLTNWNNSWDKITWVFTTYYHMDAVGVAKTLYSAGWTENSTGRYKLGDLVELISRYLGINTPDKYIGVLKELGLSPIVVADIANHKGNYNWLSVYRQQGYTATDAAAWYNYDEPYTSGKAAAGWTKQSFALYKAGGTISFLAKRGGYSLNDIAVGIKYVYELDQNTALDLLKKTNRGTSIGWADSDIVAAVSLAYGVDPIPNVIRTMINSGATVSQVASSLKYDFGVKDPLKLATYLDQAGYGQNDVLRGLLDVFYQGIPSADAFKMLAQTLQGVYQQKQESITAILQAAGATTPEGAIRVLNQAGYNLHNIAQILKDAYNVTASAATGFLLNSGYYKQSDVITEIQLVFGGDYVTIILQAAGATTPEGAIRVLNQAGYNLHNIAQILKDAYNVTSSSATGFLLNSGYYKQSDVMTEIQLVFGGDYITIYLQYLKSQGYDAAVCYERLVNVMGIKDLLVIFTYLKDVYSESDALYAVFWNSRDNILVVLKNAYGLNDPVAVGRQIKQVPLIRNYYGLFEIVSQFRNVFPGVNSALVAKALQAAGYAVYGGGSGDIFEWLRSNEENGQRDDALAAILGKANPDDLNLEAVHTAEILRYKGYSLEEVASWLKKDDYALVDIIDALDAQWQEQGIVSVLTVLKNQGYSLDELAGGIMAFERHMGSDDLIFCIAWTYAYLIESGYSMESAAGALLKLGVPVTDLVRIMGDYSIDMAIEKHNPSLRLPAADIATALYMAGKNRPEISLSLVDIARGLNANASGDFNLFTRKGVLEGMKTVGGKYLEDAVASGQISLPSPGALHDPKLTDGSALCTLRLADLSAGDAATTLKEARYGWSEALGVLLVAGYSTGDSVSALWNNGYRNAIGADIINLMSNAGKMVVDPGIFGALKLVGTLAYTGFKIGTAR